MFLFYQISKHLRTFDSLDLSEYLFGFKLTPPTKKTKQNIELLLTTITKLKPCLQENTSKIFFFSTKNQSIYYCVHFIARKIFPNIYF